MQTIKEIYEFLMSIMEQVTVFLIGLSLVAFLWGVLRYFWYSDSAEKRKSSKDYMFYGIISMFVVTTLWGLVYFVGDAVGIDLREETYDQFLDRVNNTQDGVTQNTMTDLYNKQVDFKNPLLDNFGGLTDVSGDARD